MGMGGYGGMDMMGGIGGYGGMMGMGMGMGGMGMGMGHPGITSALFTFQQLVFSLGQAMQILGMNTQALSQIFQSGVHMFHNARNAICDMKDTIEDHTSNLCSTDHNKGQDTEEQRKKRRRLQVLRWSLALAVSYAGYRFVRYFLRKRRMMGQHKQIGSASPPPSNAADMGGYSANRSGYGIRSNARYNYHGGDGAYEGMNSNMYGTRGRGGGGYYDEQPQYGAMGGGYGSSYYNNRGLNYGYGGEYQRGW